MKKPQPGMIPGCGFFKVERRDEFKASLGDAWPQGDLKLVFSG